MFSIGCPVLMNSKSITGYVYVWGRNKLIGNTFTFLAGSANRKTKWSN